MASNMFTASMMFGLVHSLGMSTTGNEEFRILVWSRSAYDNSMRDKNLDKVPKIRTFLQRRQFSEVGPITGENDLRCSNTTR